MSIDHKPGIVTPIVHLNGTSKEALKDMRSDVYDALNVVADKLREMGPNGRDYYPEPGRMELAIAQHQRRCQIIRDLQAEIEQEMDMIDEQTRGLR